jgi:N-acetyl-anhydromuramyl-L-alanine amidase AmpD
MRALQDILVACDVVINLAAKNYNAPVPYSSRVGIMLHFDASRTDQGAINWFDDSEFLLSYNRAYTDNGRRIRLTPAIENRAYHAGKCRSDSRVHDAANSAFYGLAITAGDGQVATTEQFTAICVDAAVIARYHQLRGDPGWELANIDYWITGHEDWAIFNSKDNPSSPKLWGKLGRKHDPTGENPKKGLPPVLDKAAVRTTVAAYLEDAPNGPFWSSYRFV